MRLLIVTLFLVHALITAGCASAPRDTVEVDVPVPTSCVDVADIPAAPQIMDEQALLKLNRRVRTLTVWDERLTLKQEVAELRALLAACSGGD